VQTQWGVPTASCKLSSLSTMPPTGPRPVSVHATPSCMNTHRKGSCGCRTMMGPTSPYSSCTAPSGSCVSCGAASSARLWGVPPAPCAHGRGTSRPCLLAKLRGKRSDQWVQRASRGSGGPQQRRAKSGSTPVAVITTSGSGKLPCPCKCPGTPSQHTTHCTWWSRQCPWGRWSPWLCHQTTEYLYRLGKLVRAKHPAAFISPCPLTAHGRR
jgi:hypothetical protein